MDLAPAPEISKLGISIPIHETNEKLHILPVAPLLAEGIRRVHEDRSISELFRDPRFPELDTRGGRDI